MELIKVHVTPEQIAMLEFLVRRRMSDIEMNTRVSGDRANEYVRLQAIQKELQHAGT